MSNDLIDLTDLAHLPGAPFIEAEVDEAVAALRGELGWHIAPERDETVLLDVADSDPVLRLPSRYVVTVDEIRNVDAATVIDPTGYRWSVKLGRVRRLGAWPSGYGAVEVDFTHGYEECPPELRPIIARMIVRSRSETSVTQEAIDDYSVTYSSDGAAVDDQLETTLARYSARPSWPAAV